MNCEHCKLELVAGQVQPSHSPCWYEKGAFEIQYGAKVAVVHTTERCRDRLKAMLADDDRILRASVPERWKTTTSAVGGAQSYIAELENAMKGAQKAFIQAEAEKLERTAFGEVIAIIPMYNWSELREALSGDKSE